MAAMDYQYDPFPEGTEQLFHEPSGATYFSASPSRVVEAEASGPFEGDDWEVVSVSNLSNTSQASRDLEAEGGSACATLDILRSVPLQGSLEEHALRTAFSDMESVSAGAPEDDKGGEEGASPNPEGAAPPYLSLEDGFEHLECDGGQTDGNLSFSDMDDKRLASSILPGTPPSICTSEASEDATVSDYQSGSDSDGGEAADFGATGWEDLKGGASAVSTWVRSWLEDLRTPCTPADCGDSAEVAADEVDDCDSSDFAAKIDPQCWVDAPLQLAAAISVNLSEHVYPMLRLKAMEMRDRVLVPMYRGWNQLSGAVLRAPLALSVTLVSASIFATGLLMRCQILSAKLDARDAEVEQLQAALRLVTRTVQHEGRGGAPASHDLLSG